VSSCAIDDFLVAPMSLQNFTSAIPYANLEYALLDTCHNQRQVYFCWIGGMEFRTSGRGDHC
jgi:hypothetical protein